MLSGQNHYVYCFNAYRVVFAEVQALAAMNHRRNQSLSTHASQTWPLSHIFLMIM